MYHCGTAPVALHIANGMYGAIIVDPRQGRTSAKEFVFVQSEFYTKALPDSTRTIDWEKLLGLAPDYVVFNGREAEYAHHPINVRVGERLRLYVVNAGPNRFSAFHVVGAIFDRAYLDGSLAHPRRDRGCHSHARAPLARTESSAPWMSAPGCRRRRWAGPTAPVRGPRPSGS